MRGQTEHRAVVPGGAVAVAVHVGDDVEERGLEVVRHLVRAVPPQQEDEEVRRQLPGPGPRGGGPPEVSRPGIEFET